MMRANRVRSITTMAMMIDDRPGPRTVIGRMENGERYRRKGHPDVDQARNQHIDPVAQDPRKQTQSCADRTSQGARHQCHDQGNACAVERAAENIAAKGIGAQPETRLGAALPDRRQPAQKEILFQRVLWENPWRRKGGNGQQN